MPTTNDLPPTDERAVAVRLRDNNRCAICGRCRGQGDLEVHAIVTGDDEAATRMSNYILLCKKHHRLAHQAEVTTNAS
jgi:5-methylcytosine-specific restriction endonuclease McrA